VSATGFCLKKVEKSQVWILKAPSCLYAKNGNRGSIFGLREGLAFKREEMRIGVRCPLKGKGLFLGERPPSSLQFGPSITCWFALSFNDHLHPAILRTTSRRIVAGIWITSPWPVAVRLDTPLYPATRAQHSLPAHLEAPYRVNTSWPGHP